MNTESHDISVIGSGLAGLTATLALASAGFSVVNIAPASTVRDGRTTALLHDSLAFMDKLGIGGSLREGAAPLSVMRIVDATGRFPRAPQVEFRSSEIGLDAFGYNCRNDKAQDLLRSAIAACSGAKSIDAALETARISSDRRSVRLVLSDQREMDCRLLIGADGRGSKVRQEMHFGERRWDYPQSALVLNFSHSVDHHNVSTEFHTPTGPFTTVPLAPRQSSLVWVETPARTVELSRLQSTDLARAVEREMHSMLGQVEIISQPQCFPLTGMISNRFGEGPVLLVGEAGHAFPPIGAQGFNLGIRDIETATELAISAGREKLATIGDGYDRQRRGDVRARSLSVDLLNRSLLSSLPPAQFARAFGLSLLADFSPIRRFAMREGISPGLGMHSLFADARPEFLHRFAPSRFTRNTEPA